MNRESGRTFRVRPTGQLWTWLGAQIPQLQYRWEQLRDQDGNQSALNNFESEHPQPDFQTNHFLPLKSTLGLSLQKIFAGRQCLVACELAIIQK